MTLANGKKVVIETPDGQILDTTFVEDIDFTRLPSLIGIRESDDAVHIIIPSGAELSNILVVLSKNHFSSSERHY